MDSVEMLVNDLENLVYNAKKTVFGNNNEVVLNRSQMLGLIGEIKRCLPEEIRDARIIKQDANRILGDAQNKANAIVQQAESTRQIMLSESDIISEATEHANQIKAQAEDLKESVEYDVKLKIDQLLSDTEANLNDALSLVRSNRESLRTHLDK